MISLVRLILREPLAYFLLVGALLFVLTGQYGQADDAHTIVLSATERQRLHDQWLAQAGKPPTAQELQGLVDDWIREEIYFREALALGLDQGDVIIRRRLAQKLAFMTEDLATAAEPDGDALAAYYRANLARYRQPDRYSFSHRFFSEQRHADPAAAARAALADPASSGDPFMLQGRYAGQSEEAIARLFGADFAAAIAALPVSGWQGPIPSAYGWHIVQVEAHLPASEPALADVLATVRSDYLQAQREAANAALYHALRNRYEIVGS